jgi:3-oxoacyl-[acyl-carrier protein] reductase
LEGIDILVNNDGIAVIDYYRLEDLDRTLAVNVCAVFVAAPAAARHMTAGGRIINVGAATQDVCPLWVAASTP